MWVVVATEVGKERLKTAEGKKKQCLKPGGRERERAGGSRCPAGACAERVPAPDRIHRPNAHQRRCGGSRREFAAFPCVDLPFLQLDLPCATAAGAEDTQHRQ